MSSISSDAEVNYDTSIFKNIEIFLLIVTTKQAATNIKPSNFCDTYKVVWLMLPKKDQLDLTYTSGFTCCDAQKQIHITLDAECTLQR